jgi:hypothetical protein
VSFRQPAETIEEAIGFYKHDQKRARFGTRNPIFWVLRIVEWMAQLPFWLVSLFGFSQEKAQESKSRQFAKGAFRTRDLYYVRLATSADR